MASFSFSSFFLFFDVCLAYVATIERVRYSITPLKCISRCCVPGIFFMHVQVCMVGFRPLFLRFLLCSMNTFLPMICTCISRFFVVAFFGKKHPSPPPPPPLDFSFSFLEIPCGFCFGL